MYSDSHPYKQLEDELYRDEENGSEGSEADSELEFHLYSQLHYSSNVGEVSELEDKNKETDGFSAQDNYSITDANKQDCLSENKCAVKKPSMIQKETDKKTIKNVNNKFKNKVTTSTFLEEVIVIDSSPDVISISESDTSDGPEGVCASKGWKFHTSTPQEGKKKEMSAAVSVTSSESDSESDYVLDSSSSSDSEDLENWMILGRGQQDGDHSISLNIDGVDTETDIEELDETWLISDKDKQARIFNKAKGARAFVHRVASRYYTNKNVHCRNCDKMGHLSKNCPEPKKVSPCLLCGTVGHLVSSCPYKHCHNCGLPGHSYYSCSERSYWYKQCHRCSMTGHFHDDCPELWRQYHLTIKMGPPIKSPKNGLGRTPAYCYNCARKGHFGHECQRQRMFNGTYPNTPFINHYDTKEEIRSRRNRVEHKAAGFKNNGLIPNAPQSPATPGPSMKKQKTAIDKSNQRQKRTPRQSFKSDLPVSSHIFFRNTSDSKSKPTKQQKHKPVSTGKSWTPKRPVPQFRDSLSKATIEDDFPRGGGDVEEKEKKKKKKKKKGHSPFLTNKSKSGLSLEQKKNMNVHQRKRKKEKSNKKTSDKMYPTDENLFIIKQRKQKR